MHRRAMNESRPTAHVLMACLGEESRFRLIQELIGGARCVTDLAAAVGLSQSCTTRHLQALERRRLVTGKRDGKRVLYRIREDDPGLLPLLGWALSDPGFRARPRGRPPRPTPGRAAVGDAKGRAQGAPPSSAGVPARIPATEQPTRPRDETPADRDGPLEPAGRTPRGGGSDIEDYLL